MHLLTFITLCGLARLAGCLSSVDENALDAVFQDLEKQNLVERLTGELAKRQKDADFRALVPDLGTILERPILPVKDTCSRACCDNRKTRVYLGKISPGVSNGMPDVVSVVSAPTTSGNVGDYDCNKRALLKIQFEKFAGCPFCGRYLLKIDIELSREARSSGHPRIFNIGDSVSNDGWKGDSGHQKYDAEADGSGNDIRIYGNDHCKDSAFNPLTFSNALAPGVTHATIYIGNEYIRVTNDMGFDQESCSTCLYALNGQPDTTVNQDIYIALNRVVSGRSDRNGYGVCAATFSWVCGWK